MGSLKIIFYLLGFIWEFKWMRLWRMESYVVESLRLGLLYICLIIILSGFLMMVGFLCNQKDRLVWGKLVAFECGFDPLRRTRTPFCLRFFLLALLFLIFDVEIILLLPYIYRIKIIWAKLRFIRKICYFSLLLVLFLGLAHEYNEGSLDWVFDE